MAGDCEVRIERPPEEVITSIEIAGVIDERADLSFFQDLRGPVRINLRHLHRINSFGVKSWTDHMKTMPDDVQLELTECPPPFVDQLNIFEGFVGDARIVSFLIPYTCEACEVDHDELIDTEACRRLGRFPENVKCPECGEPMEPEELESLYLRFLSEER